MFLPSDMIIDAPLIMQLRAAAVEAPPAAVDWAGAAKELDTKSPLEIMDHVSYCVHVSIPGSGSVALAVLCCGVVKAVPDVHEQACKAGVFGIKVPCLCCSAAVLWHACFGAVLWYACKKHVRSEQHQLRVVVQLPLEAAHAAATAADSATRGPVPVALEPQCAPDSL